MATNNELELNENIVDVDLSVLRKKRFRIDGDNNRILELNVSDVGIVARLSDSYPKLDELTTKAQSIGTEKPKKAKAETELEINEDEIEREEFQAMGNTLTEIDAEMRKIIDYIFDSNVSEVCAPFGNMYDPIEGQFRYEIIINTIANLYENNISKEATKIHQRIEKHTNKYTKKRK